MLATLGIESGTWSPTPTYATPGDVSVSYVTRVGTYIRIGTWVVVSFQVVFTPTYTTASGDFQIGGLPIATAVQPVGSAAFIGGGSNVIPAYPAGATTYSLILNAAAQAIRFSGQGSSFTANFGVTEITSAVQRHIRGTIIYTS